MRVPENIGLVWTPMRLIDHQKHEVSFGITAQRLVEARFKSNEL
jgi:hypothetical protein